MGEITGSPEVLHISHSLHALPHDYAVANPAAPCSAPQVGKSLSPFDVAPQEAEQ